MTASHTGSGAVRAKLTPAPVATPRPRRIAREAVALFAATDMVDDQAHARRDLAEVLARPGRLAEAAASSSAP